MTGDDLAPTRRYAEAYPAFDTDTLRELPAPHLRFRHVNPGGYLGLDSADDDIDGIASQISLTATGREFVREHQAFVTVEDVAVSFQRG